MVKGGGGVAGIGSVCPNIFKKKIKEGGKHAWMHGNSQIKVRRDKEYSFRGVEFPCFQLQGRSLWSLFSLHALE